jgi:RNA polymerase sigma factor (sigma-70 family)
MADAPTTQPSLLVRIRDAQDRLAWNQFVEIYAPLVYGFARKHGLQDADAADLTQEVLRAVAGAASRLEYDPERGSFRGWLFTVVRNKLRTFLARRKRQAQGTGNTDAQAMLEQQPSREEDQAEGWERDYEGRLFAWAAERVRTDFEDKTWQAFWRTAVDGQSPQETAAALGMTVGAVYIARSRVLARLKQEIRQVQAD